jgi:hypothetical protein
MTEAGVNQRLNQVGKSGISGFDYTYEPELKKLVAEQEKQANGFKVSSVQGMSEAGVNTRLMQMKRPVTDDDILDGNGSYEHPKVDEGYPFALTQVRRPVYNDDILDGNGQNDHPKVEGQ